MRTITNSEDLEKKRQKRVRQLSILLLLIMVVSSAGYAFLSRPVTPESTETVDQIGSFTPLGDKWVLNLGSGRSMQFSHKPEEVSNISVSVNVSLQDFYSLPLLIDAQGEEKDEFLSTLGLYASRVQEVCYGPCERDLPEKQCNEQIVVVRKSQENRVYQIEKCVFIEGDTRAVDRFVFNLLDFD